jgi:hypothetical protein
VLILLAFKLLFPRSFHMNRGNHVSSFSAIGLLLTRLLFADSTGKHRHELGARHVPRRGEAVLSSRWLLLFRFSHCCCVLPSQVLDKYKQDGREIFQLVETAFSRLPLAHIIQDDVNSSLGGIVFADHKP